MALPASGALKFSNINTELGLTSTAALSLGASNVRTLYGVATGAIRLAADGYGKSNGVNPGSGVTTASTPIIYQFSNSSESFTPQGATLTNFASFMFIDSTSTDPAIRRTVSFAGSKYRYIQIAIFAAATVTWDGKVFYTTAGHPESGSFYGQMTQPAFDGANWQYITIDMSALTVGGTDWTDNNITGIRFDFGLTTLDDFYVDYIVLRGTIYPVAGLYQSSKAGYHNEVATYMDSGITAVGATNTVANNAIPTTTTYSYVGYFLAPTTGLYRFAINTDDGGYLWVGTNAVSGYTTANASANYGGLHGAAAYVYTAYQSLTAGTYYPIRMVTGNNGGSGAAYLAFEGPGIALTTAGTNYFYYNADTNGI